MLNSLYVNSIETDLEFYYARVCTCEKRVTGKQPLEGRHDNNFRRLSFLSAVTIFHI